MGPAGLQIVSFTEISIMLVEEYEKQGRERKEGNDTKIPEE